LQRIERRGWDAFELFTHDVRTWDSRAGIVFQRRRRCRCAKLVAVTIGETERREKQSLIYGEFNLARAAYFWAGVFSGASTGGGAQGTGADALPAACRTRDSGDGGRTGA
jgi:hypothetical protein